MCGILGAIGKFDRPSFEKGLHRLAHRGPDGYGLWEEPDSNVTFGHRRLSILDLSDMGKQPMTDGELTIIYNGEIYNYKEIKKVLEANGHHFQSACDTEVILKAYREWGHRCLERFNGMWAFAIWDDKQKNLFMARDRFGVKPLFYAHTKNGFVFGSEMKALAPLLDEVAMSKDFTWCKENIYEYENSSKSLLKDIYRFPAGHYAYFYPHNNALKLQRYWNTFEHIGTVTENYNEQVERFRELFFDSCKIRMRSDVKIGTALSGGLDSSSVAAAMHYLGTNGFIDHEHTDWQNAFVATFTGTELDERDYANMVVQSLDLKGHFYEIDATKGIDTLSDYLWYFEELFLTSPIPMVEIYKAIKANGVSVSLDGHGADELLAGYGTTIFNAVKDSPFNIHGIKEIAATYKQLRGIDRSDFTVVVDGFAGRKNMLKFYLSKLINFNEEHDYLVKELGYFNAALYKEFHFYILPTLLRNYDRYSMTAGVEVRMPFMDYRLVTYCFSLPWQSKLRNGFTKAILRDAIQPVLTEQVVRRKSKTGFGTPFTNWFLGPWKEFIKDTIHSSAFKNSSVINAARVKSKVDNFYAKQNPAFEEGPELWAELMPFFWEVAFYKKLNDL
jgi:asparagine synthase (glutamine-hydrolysing)